MVIKFQEHNNDCYLLLLVFKCRSKFYLVQLELQDVCIGEIVGANMGSLDLILNR